MKNQFTIALLGQPNAGKSTLFNGLTGAHQHVGNWPGKTVEKKEGYFRKDDKEYVVVDLPGSYSLFANSDEEVITRDYIANGNADLVVILADATQLERSLFMLADYTGIHVPAILLLNLMDVATEQGKIFQCEKLAEKLQIPVLPFDATNTKAYAPFYEIIENVKVQGKIVAETRLCTYYQKEFPGIFHDMLAQLPPEGIGVFSSSWLVAKLIEQDGAVIELVKRKMLKERYDAIMTFANEVRDGSLHTGNCKFQWIEYLLQGCVSAEKKVNKLSKFDRFATSKIWGKPFAIGMILFGLILAMTIGAPIMTLGGLGIPALGSVITAGLQAIHAPNLLIGLLQDGIITAVAVSVMMSGFVLGTLLVFGFLEESGYLARVSFVFDHTMQKLGLHGKAIMPFLVSFGCNIGGTAGTRVLDSWGQKVTTIAMSWVIPCGSTWGVLALISSLFFGANAIWIILALFLVSVLHMYMTAKIFGGKLLKESDKRGIIMELPPYHKPKWGNLFKYACTRSFETLIKALKIIIPVSVIFWLLSYTPDQDIENSIIYQIGQFIEPVTMFFGLRWQMFMAWLVAGVGKEATLGALTALFSEGTIWSSNIVLRTAAIDNTLISNSLLATITKPEALAFIFAYYFHMPCLMTVGSVIKETHSWQWTLKIVLYYLGMSLFLGMCAYHVGNLIF